MEEPQNSGELVERNEDGTFKPGHTKLGGRTLGKKNYSTIMDEAIEELADETGMDADVLRKEAYKKAFVEARKGNYSFYRDMLDRTHGKPTQTIIGTVDVTSRPTVDRELVTTIAKELNERLRKYGTLKDPNSNGGGVAGDTGALGS